jgi:hypothetical protein
MASKTLKGTTRSRPAKKGEGSGGYRAGTMKEKVHQIFVKFGKNDPEKAKAAALKINPNASTISNWFSQFRAEG